MKYFRQENVLPIGKGNANLTTLPVLPSHPYLLVVVFTPYQYDISSC